VRRFGAGASWWRWSWRWTTVRRRTTRPRCCLRAAGRAAAALLVLTTTRASVDTRQNGTVPATPSGRHPGSSVLFLLRTSRSLTVAGASPSTAVDIVFPWTMPASVWYDISRQCTVPLQSWWWHDGHCRDLPKPAPPGSRRSSVTLYTAERSTNHCRSWPSHRHRRRRPCRGQRRYVADTWRRMYRATAAAAAKRRRQLLVAMRPPTGSVSRRFTNC